MKSLKFILLSTIAFLLLTSVKLFSQTEVEREVDQFSSIDMRISGNLYLSQGDQTKLVIKGDPGDIEDLQTYVKSDRLVIRFDSWKIKYDKLDIYVTTPAVNGIEVSGSGNVEAQTAIQSDDLKLEVSGSGEITIQELNAPEVDVEISGSGEVKLAGSEFTREMEIEISGSGDVEAFGLQIKKCAAEITGSGEAEVFVTEKLVVEISGSGDVYYKGSPQIDADITGSGKVKSK